MALSDELWAGVRAIYEAILAHPFLAGLTGGELDLNRFRYFVVQDAHYLRAYARVLDLLADRAPDPAINSMLRRHAADANAVERELHSGLLADLPTGPEMDASPTTVAYGNFLAAAVLSGTFAEGLGAVLPCYVIYWEVGMALAERSSPEPLYARWIATYAGADFARVVSEVVAVADWIGVAMSRAERDRIRNNFFTASRYEWMFWDAAWRLEAWPV